jgi:hypothetical protein
MPNDKATLISDLTTFFNDTANTSTPSSKAQDFADLMEKWVKTFSLQASSLTSSGTGNLGAPVVSTNSNGGTLV